MMQIPPLCTPEHLLGRSMGRGSLVWVREESVTRDGKGCCTSTWDNTLVVCVWNFVIVATEKLQDVEDKEKKIQLSLSFFFFYPSQLCPC